MSINARVLVVCRDNVLFTILDYHFQLLTRQLWHLTLQFVSSNREFYFFIFRNVLCISIDYKWHFLGDV